MRTARTFARQMHEEAFDQPCGVGRALGLDTNELWVDEHSRLRLLDAIGQLTVEDLLVDSAGGSLL